METHGSMIQMENPDTVVSLLETTSGAVSSALSHEVSCVPTSVFSWSVKYNRVMAEVTIYAYLCI